MDLATALLSLLGIFLVEFSRAVIWAVTFGAMLYIVGRMADQ